MTLSIPEQRARALEADALLHDRMEARLREELAACDGDPIACRYYQEAICREHASASIARRQARAERGLLA